MKTTIPLLLAFLFTPITNASEVYREVGEGGVPVFSDQKLPGGEKSEIREPSTFSDPLNNRKQRKIEKLSPETPVTSSMYILAITDPPDGAAIRNNAGNLALTVKIEPGLSPGDTAKLMMDGLAIRNLSASGPVQLSNVDRGSHQFGIRIVNKKGTVVAESPVSSITVLRYSKLQRAN